MWNCKLKWLQANHTVTLENWITIIFYVKSIDKLMLIIFHYLSYLNLQCTLNKMKSWGHMKFVNESEIASWNDFKQNIAWSTLGNWMIEIIMLSHWYTSIYSFHQLSYFEFAVYIKLDEKLRTYEIVNECEIASWNDFKQIILLLLKIG